MDPLQRFSELLHKVRDNPGLIEPTGMTLSTVGADGRPSARVVLLKGLDARGLVFYTNSLSRKGRDLKAHPDVALTFWWPQVETQVRFEGAAERVSDEESDAYFATRVRMSQIGAWASQQSEELSSRAELDDRFAAVEKQYEGKTIPRPPHWFGYRVAPVYVEFWFSRPGRLHERDAYLREKPGAPWTMKLLNP
jgi:pyridoxamine 5'-phosphate oxidase